MFSNGRLQVGPTLIPAWAVLPVANGNIERPIDEARQKEKPRPARRGRMPGIEAVRDELTYDEMLHLADVVEGWMLDHRTRRDKLAMLERMADELRDLAHELGPKWNPSRQPQRPSLIGFLGQMLGRN